MPGCGTLAAGVDQLVANPKSFAQFVENMFTLSFLIKAGKLLRTRNPPKHDKLNLRICISIQGSP